MTAKTVLVTGASRGIDRAVAILAAQRGWSVIVNFLHNDVAAQQVVDMVKTLGAKSIKIQGDVAREDDVIRVFREASTLGPLDGVVINAGIVSPPLPLVDMALDRLQRMFDVNVLGAYLCAREAARQMIKSRGGNGGSIVLVSLIGTRFSTRSQADASIQIVFTQPRPVPTCRHWLKVLRLSCEGSRLRHRIRRKRHHRLGRRMLVGRGQHGTESVAQKIPGAFFLSA